MMKPKILIIKKSLAVAGALIVGFLMPYLSRIPLAFTYGTNWIWKYMHNFDDFLRWNGFHLGSLLPLIMFGLLYIFGEVKWAFYTGVFGHFAATCLIYYNFGEHYGPDDFLGCILFPFPIAGVSFLCGIIGLIAELYFKHRKSKLQSNVENVYE